MPKVPDLNVPKKNFGEWKPDKQEKFNMRYWKGKKAEIKNTFFVCSVCKKDCETRDNLKKHWDLEH